jgi:hypothetical protein
MRCGHARRIAGGVTAASFAAPTAVTRQRKCRPAVYRGFELLAGDALQLQRGVSLSARCST